jgi:hypothetical protein
VYEGGRQGEVVSERVSWIECPECGAPAAVGWATTAWAEGQSVEEVPVELDCSAGCPVSLEEFRPGWDETD